MNIKEDQNCPQQLVDYIEAIQASIRLWEGQVGGGCHAQRLRETLQAFEERNKDPRRMTDEEISIQIEMLRGRIVILGAEQQERYEARKARANNELARQDEARREKNRVAQAQMAEQAEATQRAEQLSRRAAKAVVIPETKEERLAKIEKITGPLIKL